MKPTQVEFFVDGLVLEANMEMVLLILRDRQHGKLRGNR